MTWEKCGIKIGAEKWLEIKKGGVSRRWQLPSFPLSKGVTGVKKLLDVSDRPFHNGIEVMARYELNGTDVRLLLRLQAREDTAFLRMRYELEGDDTFCGIDGDRCIAYGGIAMSSDRIWELQISQFDRILHSFVPSKNEYEREAFVGERYIGPIVVAEDSNGVVLTAYEHGAQAPDHFLSWKAEADGMFLTSVKGNYFNGQKAEAYAAPWIEIGIARSTEEVFRTYRRFMLEDMAAYGDSRKPYVFFNTWHNQEGKKYFDGDSYLKYMNEEFTLRDIDIAHEMGVEVYVIDTGWFQKTGDWEVNEKFFPNRMKRVRERLDQYGMRLGLWFNPIAAARTSGMYRTHPECVMSLDGEETYWGKIWETEESYGMCLASEYSDLFIERLVDLNRTLGVTYFKWDAVGQYGCNSPDHNHGTGENPPKERADAYAYRMGLEMIRIAQEVSRRCPGAIVDFDITEGERFVGLGFLAAGKYFLINNGPYFHNFDIPSTVKMEPDTINVFFYPGAARPQICRQAVKYDPYIPSILFLTHFFPHGTSRIGQKNSQAAFALGGNGIWGFLQEMRREDIEDWADFLSDYKKVRDDITEAYPVSRGVLGGSPEIYEKINPETGRGIVVLFTHGKGTFSYLTQRLEQIPDCVKGAKEYAVLENNRIRIHVDLEEDEAKVIFLI